MIILGREFNIHSDKRCSSETLMRFWATNFTCLCLVFKARRTWPWFLLDCMEVYDRINHGPLQSYVDLMTNIFDKGRKHVLMPKFLHFSIQIISSWFFLHPWFTMMYNQTWCTVLSWESSFDAELANLYQYIIRLSS